MNIKNQFKMNQNEIILIDPPVSVTKRAINDNMQTNNIMNATNRNFYTNNNELNNHKISDKSQLKRHSSSLLNIYETNNNYDISPYFVSNSIITNKSSVDKAKKICLEAINIKTSQQNSCNSFQTSK